MKKHDGGRDSLWVLVVALCLGPAASADILVTTDGKRWEGKVTEEEDAYILVKIGGGRMRFPKGMVQEVIREAPKPTPKASPKIEPQPEPKPEPPPPPKVEPPGGELTPEITAAIAALDRMLAESGTDHTTASRHAIRQALFKLDLATEGRDLAGPAHAVRQRARTVLAQTALPKPVMAVPLEAYRSGRLRLKDRNRVAQGEARSAQKVEYGWPFPRILYYCPKLTREKIPGLYLYTEDIEQLLVRAEGILHNTEKGTYYIGRIRLSEQDEAGWLVPHLRALYGLAPGGPLMLYFHEGEKETVVLALAEKK